MGQYQSQDRCFSAVAHSGSADGGMYRSRGRYFSAEAHSGNADGGAVPISGQVILSRGALRKRYGWGSTNLGIDTCQQGRIQAALTVGQYQSRDMDFLTEARSDSADGGADLSQDRCFSSVADSGRADGGMYRSRDRYLAEVHSGRADSGAVPISRQVLPSRGALRQR